VATGKEDDAKAALAAEASLKEAILASMKGTTNPAPARADHQAGARIPRLHQKSSPRSSGSGRQHADRAEPARPQRDLDALQARRSAEQRDRTTELEAIQFAPRR